MMRLCVQMPALEPYAIILKLEESKGLTPYRGI